MVSSVRPELLDHCHRSQRRPALGEWLVEFCHLWTDSWKGLEGGNGTGEARQSEGSRRESPQKGTRQGEPFQVNPRPHCHTPTFITPLLFPIKIHLEPLSQPRPFDRCPPRKSTWDVSPHLPLWAPPRPVTFNANSIHVCSLVPFLFSLCTLICLSNNTLRGIPYNVEKGEKN